MIQLAKQEDARREIARHRRLRSYSGEGFGPRSFSCLGLGLGLSLDSGSRPGGDPGPTPPTMTVAITSPAPGATVFDSIPVTITVTVSQAANVAIKKGATTLGSATMAGLTGTYVWTPVTGDIGAQTINATATATVGGSTANASPVSVTVADKPLGFVATRGSVPLDFGAGNLTAIMARTFHFATDDITAVSVAWANFYGDMEASTGGTLTVKASIEYPAGTFTQLTFGGSATGATAAKLLTSDLVTLTTPIPNGAKFFVRFYRTHSTGLLTCTTGNFAYLAGGDAVKYGGTDQTMSGTVVNDGAHLGFYPAAIIGRTVKRSLFLVGDSRTAGAADVADATGNLGELARPLGQYGYCNTATSGGQLVRWLTSTSARLALAQYASTVVVNMGTNDIAQATRTGDQVFADLGTLRALLPAKEFWVATIGPNTFGSAGWTLADGSDQTPAAEPFSQRIVDLNTLIRGPSTFTGFLELATQVQLSGNAKKWRADGVTNHYTADGAHATQFGNKAIVLTLP